MSAETADAGESTLEGGSYEVIRRRLLDRATELGARCDALNQARQKLFGGRELQFFALSRHHAPFEVQFRVREMRDLAGIAGRTAQDSANARH